MRILLVGSGGREHAIARQISVSPSFIDTNSKLYAAPGNPGISSIAEIVDLNVIDLDAICNFAEYNKIDLTVIGPEIPLCMGLADKLNERGLLAFGPSKNASRIESSKIFSKELMQKHNIPTAKFKQFTASNSDQAYSYISSLSYPVVIKADGLAAGKGVIIAQTQKEAVTAIKDFTEKKIFGLSGLSFIIEEFLTGREVSLFAVTDGKDYVLLPPSQDHKRAGENDTGKNTGGMGAYAPAGEILNSDSLLKVEERILKPVLNALREAQSDFKGCLYCGLIINERGDPFVIEFNCRFGDPETQAVLPLIKSDFLELLFASAKGKISSYKLQSEEIYTCCVVLCSEGYPDEYEKGKQIKIEEDIGSLIFHSGTQAKDGKLVTAGGRVISIVGMGKSLNEARENTYNDIKKINFDNKYYRRDIAGSIL